jgi:hypothetical protein
VALTTDDVTQTTAAASPTAPAPEAPRPPRRRAAVLAWIGAGLGVAAVAAVSIAALRDDDRPATVDDNARTVIEHGSIAALDHRLDVDLAQRTQSQTAADHSFEQDPTYRAQVAQAEEHPLQTTPRLGVPPVAAPTGRRPVYMF